MSSQLFTKNTKAIFFNQHPIPIKSVLDYDFLCKKDCPSIVAIVNPTYQGFHKATFGSTEVIIPVYKSIIEAYEKHSEAEVLINFASKRTAYTTTKEAVENCPNLRVVHIMAEGIAENEARELIQLFKTYKKIGIGPATVGAINPGCFRTANPGGAIENIILTKLYRPGSVGVVTKSGGMSGETYNMVSRRADGTFEGVAVGGDLYPITTMAEHLIRMNSIPEIKMLICLGEVGGTDEYDIAEAMKNGEITKPLIAWVTGTIAEVLPPDVQFGHAGAKSSSYKETATAKNNALREAGAYVPLSYNDLGNLVEEKFKEYVLSDPNYQPPNDDEYNILDSTYKVNIKNITSTISDDRGEELTYNKIAANEYVDKSIGHLINGLWFKGILSEKAENFIEIAIKLSADHGPAVATAHNAIVTARAGKDIVDSLIAGLTTIGPRHGGAIDGAARWCFDAVRDDKDGKDILEEHKAKGELIMGIGHRIKSVQNPDKRVSILKEFAMNNIADTKFLNKALEVEEETTKKKNNLILNLDGAIGAIFLDFLYEANLSEDEMNEIIEIGALNAIFILARSIGIIGHALDQKRLKEGLYRHSWEDISYL
jgi:succinyl-CoA synthetase alpha subunit